MRESRRGFLRKVVLLGEVLVVGGLVSGDSGSIVVVDGTFRARFDQDPSLSFIEAEEIAIRANKLYEKLPLYDQEITLAWLNELVARFIPILVEVGVIRQPVYPSIKVMHFIEPWDFENARARVKDCTPELEFSDRLFDPADPWSADAARAMAGVVHEIVHPQQGPKLCLAATFAGSDRLIESSADIASMEAMAYALYHDFPEAIFGLMSRLRESSLATALVLAAIENRPKAGIDLIGRIGRDISERKSLLKDLDRLLLAMRASRGGHGRGGDPSVVAANLPISLVVSAIRQNHGLVEGLMLSPVGGYKEPRTENTVDAPAPFALTNLTRFLARAEAIVAGMA